jgi:hyperosmotically inducible protein
MRKTTLMAALAGGLLLAPGLAAADDRDDELQTKVENRLAHDPQLRDNQVSVSVDEGIVKLDGKVDNAGEKSRATRLAMSAGAKRIENNLELETPRSQTSTGGDLETKAKSAAHQVGKEVSDTWITSKVKTEIALAKGLDGSDISVDTNQNAVVTLTGTVPNETERQRALVVTRAVTGVREVKDALAVAPKN